jgi:hypothetical protein
LILFDILFINFLIINFISDLFSLDLDLN